MIHILNKENTILNKFLAQIRDKGVQGDSMRFRRNLERIGEIMSYEISKTMNYTTKIVPTPRCGYRNYPACRSTSASGLSELL